MGTRSKSMDWAEFACLECGKRLTARQAQRADLNGCPKCGGSDIDVLVIPKPITRLPKEVS